MLIHVPAQDCIRSRWRNDQGWTREILREPAEDNHFHWRTSIADIGQDTLYSAYTGYRRAQVLLTGAGLELDFINGQRLQLTPESPHLHFDGSAIAHCRLIDGPVQVFNLIWNPQHLHTRLLQRPLVGPMVFLPEPGVRWFVHLQSGHAHLRAEQHLPLQSGDNLLLSVPPRTRWVLDGSGQALLLRLDSDITSDTLDPSKT